jgi:hypothetical protein
MQIDISSFRDPSGFVFIYEDEIYRCIMPCYQENYDFLMTSGLYDHLVAKKMLIPHKEVQIDESGLPDCYRVIKPQRVPFISYPYEWCFSQIKDAALLVLKIQLIALDHGMTLKDGSGFNVQFSDGMPIFIDTLSFEIHKVNTPWVAYKQFCQHFIAPLALIKYVDYRISPISKNHIDGIPLDLASKLLPLRSRFRLGIFVHITLHAYFSRRYAGRNQKISTEKQLSQQSIYNLIHFLMSTVNGLHLKKIKTEWETYYKDGISDMTYLDKKQSIIRDWAEEIQPDSVWDIGSNDGKFSRIFAEFSQQVISMESDFLCVEDNYNNTKTNKESKILPLWVDLANPTPGIGWNNKERKSLLFREKKPDLIVMLAIIHHLAITYNIPMRMLAAWLGANCKRLVIEFVPKTDEKVRFLLLNREDIFRDYTEIEFEKEFSRYFSTVKKVNLSDSGRVLYLMDAL